MFLIILIIINIIFFNSNLTTATSKENVLCESVLQVCVCRYIQNVDNDFLHLNVHCSYQNNDILKKNYTLPSSVQTLDLSSNTLSAIFQAEIFQSQTMEKLLINRNLITNIDANSFLLPNLTYLDLSENRLEYFDPEIFRNVKKLQYLNIASNKLTTLPMSAFHYLNNLEKIIMDRNNIGNYLNKFDMFHRNGIALNIGIKHISICNISLNVIPENFLADAYDLRELKIAQNNISSIPELPYTLEYLDLSDNPITNINIEDFLNFPILKELKLNNLQIEEIPDYVFESMKSLRKLEIERNKNLIRFSAFAFGREVLDDADDFMLEQLSLRSSRLSTLPVELEIPFGQLHKLDLQGNMWKCDCKIKWFKNLQMPSQDVEHLR